MSEDDEEYTCDVCDRSFDTKRGLSSHERQAHDDDDTDEETGEETETDEQPVEQDDTTAVPSVSDDAVSGPVIEARYQSLGAGIVVGFLVAALLAVSGVIPAGAFAEDEVSPDTAQSTLQSFIADNREALQLPENANMTVQQVEQYGSGLYRVSIQFSATVQNQTINRNIPAFMTKDGQYVFFSQPLDTTRPMDEQLQQRQQ